MNPAIYISEYQYLIGGLRSLDVIPASFGFRYPKSNAELYHGLSDPDRKYKDLDRSTLFLLHLADELNLDTKQMGIHIGSSRGATALWEKNHANLKKGLQIDVRSSPLTTAGNLSSWLNQYLRLSGISNSFSATCGSFQHAFLNGISWLKSGMLDQFLVGATEAPLTEFTIQQMLRLGIYNVEGVCKPFNFSKPTGMVLGEGAGLFVMKSDPIGAKARVVGYGWSSEQIQSATYMDESGLGYRQSMQAALDQAKLDQVDLVLAHAPGTKRGDQAEWSAIKACLGEKQQVHSIKGLVGHALGASGAQNLGVALDLFNGKSPFEDKLWKRLAKQDIHTILINAAGFGGQSISLIIEAI